MQLDTTGTPLCSQTDPELFFSDKEIDIQRAKDVCRRCPLTEACLETAMRENILFGVWGGATPRERNLFKRDKRQRMRHIYITMGKEVSDEEGTQWGRV